MKRSLKQGMVNGIIHERAMALSSVRATADVLMPYVNGDRGKAYDAAFDLAEKGGQAEDVIRRYENLNASGIAVSLAAHPAAPAATEAASPKAPAKNLESAG